MLCVFLVLFVVGMYIIQVHLWNVSTVSTNKYTHTLCILVRELCSQVIKNASPIFEKKKIYIKNSNIDKGQNRTGHIAAIDKLIASTLSLRFFTNISNLILIAKTKWQSWTILFIMANFCFHWFALNIFICGSWFFSVTL